jgi:hypothetical protein
MSRSGYRERVILDANEVSYRVEGESAVGWILFDRTENEGNARMFLRQWRKARKPMKFRLIKVTTIISREVIDT